jgi:hypothetical protein
MRFKGKRRSGNLGTTLNSCLAFIDSPKNEEKGYIGLARDGLKDVWGDLKMFGDN